MYLIHFAKTKKIRSYLVPRCSTEMEYVPRFGLNLWYIHGIIYGVAWHILLGRMNSDTPGELPTSLQVSPWENSFDSTPSRTSVCWKEMSDDRRVFFFQRGGLHTGKHTKNESDNTENHHFLYIHKDSWDWYMCLHGWLKCHGFHVG